MSIDQHLVNSFVSLKDHFADQVCEAYGAVYLPKSKLSDYNPCENRNEAFTSDSNNQNTICEVKNPKTVWFDNLRNVIFKKS